MHKTANPPIPPYIPPMPSQKQVWDSCLGTMELLRSGSLALFIDRRLIVLCLLAVLLLYVESDCSESISIAAIYIYPPENFLSADCRQGTPNLLPSRIPPQVEYTASSRYPNGPLIPLEFCSELGSMDSGCLYILSCWRYILLLKLWDIL